MIKVGNTPQNEGFGDVDIRPIKKILKDCGIKVGNHYAEPYANGASEAGINFGMLVTTDSSWSKKKDKLIAELKKYCSSVQYTDWNQRIYMRGVKFPLSMMSESVAEPTAMNESAKIRDMTKAMGQGYEGHWQMPSGKPGQITNVGDFELAMMGDGEGSIQTILMDEDGFVYAKIYPEKDESKAASEFKSMAAAMSDLMDAKKFAKKFGLKSM